MVDEFHAHHAIHNLYSSQEELPQVFSESTLQWLLILLIVVSFLMLAYVLTLVQERERNEQKNK